MKNKKSYIIKLLIASLLLLFLSYPISNKFTSTICTYFGCGLAFISLVLAITSKNKNMLYGSLIISALYIGLIGFGFKTFLLSEFLKDQSQKNVILICTATSTPSPLIFWCPDETKEQTITIEADRIVIEGGSDKEFLSKLKNIRVRNYWYPIEEHSNIILTDLKINNPSFMLSLSNISKYSGNLRYYENAGSGLNMVYKDQILILDDLFECLPPEINKVINNLNY